MRTARALAAWGLAVAAVAPVSAAREASDLEVRAAVRAYAQCLVRALPDDARRFTLRQTRSVPSVSSCVPRQSFARVALRFPGDNYRYALAEALLPVDFPAGVADSFSSVPALDHGDRPVRDADAANKAAAARQDSAQGVWAYALIGECIARAQPADVFALARSEVGSAAETSAFVQLRPAIAGCLPQGTTATMKRASLRGAASLELYRLAEATLPSAVREEPHG